MKLAQEKVAFVEPGSIARTLLDEAESVKRIVALEGRLELSGGTRSLTDKFRFEGKSFGE